MKPSEARVTREYDMDHAVIPSLPIKNVIETITGGRPKWSTSFWGWNIDDGE